MTNQEAYPSTLEAESKCHMKIHKPAQALLEAESQGPMKFQKAAPGTLEADFTTVCLVLLFIYVFSDLDIFRQEEQTVVGWLARAGRQTESARKSVPLKLHEKWASKS
jgi:hypothetical protein